MNLKIYLLAALMLTGCVKSQPAIPLEEEPLENPVKVTLESKNYSGDKVNGRVKIETIGPVDSRKLVLTVNGLESGNKVSSYSKRVSEILGERKIEAGEKILIPFSVAGSSIDEIQVACLWGETATPRAKIEEPQKSTKSNQTLPPPITPEAMLRGETNIEPTVESPQKSKVEGTDPIPKLVTTKVVKTPLSCKDWVCEEKITLNAQIQNTTATRINSLKLAFGLVFSQSNSEMPKFPKPLQPVISGEDFRDLSSLQLEVGETKNLKIDFEQPVAIIEGGEFVPYARIISIGE